MLIKNPATKLHFPDNLPDFSERVYEFELNVDFLDDGSKKGRREITTLYLLDYHCIYINTEYINVIFNALS